MSPAGILRKARQKGVVGMARRLRRELRLWLLRLRHPRVVPSPYGPRFVARWGDATFRFYVLGSYGGHLASVIAGQTEPFIFFDIGANQGLYSILAAQNPACAAVHAFEPVPDTADTLTENLALNGVRNRVTLHRAAISDRTGRVEITIKAGHSGVASLRAGPDAPGARISIDTLDAGALERGIDTGGLPLVIKIDVEGHEDVVIDQLVRTRFFADAKAVFYEVDEAWVEPGRLRRALVGAGFTTFHRVGKKPHYDVLALKEAR